MGPLFPPILPTVSLLHVFDAAVYLLSITLLKLDPWALVFRYFKRQYERMVNMNCARWSFFSFFFKTLVSLLLPRLNKRFFYILSVLES